MSYMQVRQYASTHSTGDFLMAGDLEYIGYATRNAMRHVPVVSTVRALGENAMDTPRFSRQH